MSAKATNCTVFIGSAYGVIWMIGDTLGGTSLGSYLDPSSSSALNRGPIAGESGLGSEARGTVFYYIWHSHCTYSLFPRKETGSTLTHIQAIENSEKTPILCLLGYISEYCLN
jgi:hypothetical protein